MIPRAPAAGLRTFRDYMESSLYDEDRGYYVKKPIGADFYTACQLTPAFAEVLAGDFLRRLDILEKSAPPPYFIVEMGANSGLLAAQIVEAVSRLAPERLADLRYVAVERARERLLEAVLSIPKAGRGNIKVLGYERLEDIPRVGGIFFSNELVDAFPVHLLEKRNGAIHEVYVDAAGTAVLGELSRPELEIHAGRIKDVLEEGARHAINLEAPEWVKTVAEKLERGFVVTVDYGKRFGAAPNPPRGFLRHALADPLRRVGEEGERDITASVDFDVLMEEGRSRGLALESYAPLNKFLIDGGIGEKFENPALDAKERMRMKTLILPQGMGETYKVLIQKKLP